MTAHRIHIPASVTDRVIRRRGKAHPYEDLEPSRTALVVIDMQNGFMREDVAHAYCANAASVVPAINRLAGSLRTAGGKVFWIQNIHTDACLTEWSAMYDYVTPESRERRIAAMTAGSEGHAFWPEIDIRPEDMIVEKRRYSAFIEGSSDLTARLRWGGFDTVLIAGTVTNTCCESSARDATMLNFKTIMVSDGCAANSDEEHKASLIAFYLIFGDVMTTEEIEERLAARPARPEG